MHVSREKLLECEGGVVHVCVCTRVCTYVCVCVHVYVRTCVCVYTCGWSCSQVKCALTKSDQIRPPASVDSWLAGFSSVNMHLLYNLCLVSMVLLFKCVFSCILWLSYIRNMVFSVDS